MFPKIRSRIEKVSAIVRRTYAEPANLQGAYAEPICIKLTIHLNGMSLKCISGIGSWGQIYKKCTKKVTKQRGDMIDVFYSVSSPAQYKR
jgi:hypothetical protein